MLIDTGFGKDEPAIRGADRTVDRARLPLSLFPLRLNEFMSINNVETFAGHFNVEQCYTSNPDAALWFDFGAKANGRSILEFDAGHRGDPRRHDRARETGPADRRHAGADPPDRHALALRPRDAHAVQLGPVHPCLARPHADGPWIVTDDDDTTTTRELRSFMLNTRYWWLEGAPTDSIRRGIADVFDKYDVETIAPGYGCVLRGRKVVARHVPDAGRDSQGLDKSVAVSRYVSRDEER